jgi:hypothetical protein
MKGTIRDRVQEFRRVPARELSLTTATRAAIPRRYAMLSAAFWSCRVYEKSNALRRVRQYPGAGTWRENEAAPEELRYLPSDRASG